MLVVDGVAVDDVEVGFEIDVRYVAQEHSLAIELTVDDMRDPLSRARTATSLPSETPARIAIGRLWPIALTAIVAGGLGLFFPGVAVIGAGYALIVSLAWR